MSRPAILMQTIDGKEEPFLNAAAIAVLIRNHPKGPEFALDRLRAGMAPADFMKIRNEYVALGGAS